MSGVDLTPETTAAQPGDEVQRLMFAMRAALNEHPAVIPLVLTRPTSSEAALVPIEALLGALSRAGFTGPAFLGAYRTLFALLVGFAQADLTGPLSAGRPASLEQVSAGVLRLPERSFTRLRECALAAETSSSDAELSHGLDAVLRGLAVPLT